MHAGPPAPPGPPPAAALPQRCDPQPQWAVVSDPGNRHRLHITVAGTACSCALLVVFLCVWFVGNRNQAEIPCPGAAALPLRGARAGVSDQPGVRPCAAGLPSALALLPAVDAARAPALRLGTRQARLPAPVRQPTSGPPPSGPTSRTHCKAARPRRRSAAAASRCQLLSSFVQKQDLTSGISTALEQGPVAGHVSTYRAVFYVRPLGAGAAGGAVYAYRYQNGLAGGGWEGALDSSDSDAQGDDYAMGNGGKSSSTGRGPHKNHGNHGAHASFPHIVRIAILFPLGSLQPSAPPQPPCAKTCTTLATTRWRLSSWLPQTALSATAASRPLA